MTTFNHFNSHLATQDQGVAQWIAKEHRRQQNQIELIASENITSLAVMEAQGSVMTNKYAEGYPGRRYYNGCECVDGVEELAIQRVTKLFGCKFANVQPHSGAQANGAVFLALLQPGDAILGMTLNSGGHLSHGAAPNISGKWFKSIGYDVDPKTHLIDYDTVEKLALEHKPKLIIAGGSAYPRRIDFARFRSIADKIGAFLMVDMAHIAGLVAAGEHSSPFPHAHVVTSTTHKTLRGPRGGIILTNDEPLAKKINSAVFPGFQGGPLMHVIAAKAVAFGEALTPEYKTYIKNVCNNAKVLANVLKGYGLSCTTGGTDTHLMVVDLSQYDISGADAATYLEELNIACNMNAIPFDTKPPRITSGIRLGTPAATTRGFGETEFTEVGHLIGKSLIALSEGKNTTTEEEVRSRVLQLCNNFPIYALPNEYTCVSC